MKDDFVSLMESWHWNFFLWADIRGQHRRDYDNFFVVYNKLGYMILK